MSAQLTAECKATQRSYQRQAGHRPQKVIRQKPQLDDSRRVELTEAVLADRPDLQRPCVPASCWRGAAASRCASEKVGSPGERLPRRVDEQAMDAKHTGREYQKRRCKGALYLQPIVRVHVPLEKQRDKLLHAARRQKVGEHAHSLARLERGRGCARHGLRCLPSVTSHTAMHELHDAL